MAGCAAAPMGAALRAAPPPGLAPARHLPSVPFFAQDDTLCGPAVLASLLAAAGRPRPLAELVPQVYLPGRAGSLQAEMLATTRRHGLLAVALAPALADVLAELASGRPVAVLLNLALPFWPRWHYAVLVGYDLAARRVWLHSGTRADEAWPLDTFERTWARGGHWSFVALPPGALPAAAGAQRVTEALLAGDRVADPADLAPSWQAAAARWPDRLLLWMGAGNAWMAADDPDAAARAYAHAADRFDRAAAWNNLALARQRLGDRPGALVAARRAVERAQAAEPELLAGAQRTLQQVSR